MKNVHHVVTSLIILLVVSLSACNSPASTPQPPSVEPPPPVLSLRINPNTQTVTPLGSSLLSTQQLKRVQIGNDDFKLEDFEFEFLAGNRVRIVADFVNQPVFKPGETKRDSKVLLLPITFEQNKGTSAGVTSLELPEITQNELDGATQLLPDERVDDVVFLLQHRGEAFDYKVDAFSKVQSVNDCSSVTQTRFVLTDVPKLKDCEVLNGTLIINAGNTTHNLSALESLRVLNGDLQLNNLKDASDLFPALEFVRGDVTFLGFDGELSGFDALKSISGELSFSHAKSKASLAGFDALSSVSALSFSGNAFGTGRVDASFLSALSHVEVLNVALNPGFSDLAFLKNMSSVGALTITGDATQNKGLTSLAGLENLVSADTLIIQDNPRLTSITNLSKLAFVNEGRINNNAALDCSLRIALPNSKPFLPLFLPIEASSGNKVNCPTALTGDIFVSTQKQVDGLKGVTVIKGSLSIDFPEKGLSLANLSDLTEITGSLSLLKTSGSNDVGLVGLESLATIGEDFEIDVAKKTIKLDKLESLAFIGGTLRIKAGVPNLSTLPQAKNNQGFILQSVTALEIDNRNCKGTTQSPCQSFSTVFNEKSVNATFLQNVSNLSLTGTKLKNLNGLETITTLDTLNIEANPSLETITQLKNLQEVTFSTINNNAALDCSQKPTPAFLPATESTGNLINCPTEPTLFTDITITNAQQLELLKDVVVIEGSLTIQVLQGAVKDLRALSALREIKGHLIIGASPAQVALAPSNTGLATLAGLEDLTLVEGDLIIRRNKDLAELTGLSSLTNVQGFIDISENAQLDCSQGSFAFLPADFSVSNLVDCKTETDAFALESASSLLADRGELTSVEINVIERVQGFTEDIRFSLEANENISATFEPNPTQNKTVMRFTVSPTATLGTTTLVIKGTSVTSNVTKAVSIPLFIRGVNPVVTGVEILDNASSQQVRQGAGNIILRITGNHLQTLTNARLEAGPGSGINLEGQLTKDNTGRPVPPTLTQADMVFNIPHAVTGQPRLNLSTDAGNTLFDNAIIITAITVDPSATAPTTGTPDQPFASIHDALGFVRTGDTIHLKNGRYSSPSESFPLIIPAGVSVEGESTAGTIIEGLDVTQDTSVNTVVFSGDASLANVTIEKGLLGVAVDTGTVTLTNLNITGAIDALEVYGDATVTASNLTASNNTGYGVFAYGDANLTLTNATLANNTFGVVVTGNAALSMSNATISGSDFSGMYIGTTSNVTMQNSSSSNNTQHGIEVDPFNTGNVTISNMSITNNQSNGVNFAGVANLTMTATISGNTGTQFTDDRPARDNPDGIILNLVGSSLSGEPCTEGVVTGGSYSNNSLLTITRANNRVNCTIDTLF